MTAPLLTISAFARAVNLTPSALRYYHEAGLLPPAEIDARTGYRYYTPELERRAHMIRRMREVGVPVETMRLVLDGPSGAASEILHAFATDAAESAKRAAATAADVVSSLRAEEAAPEPVAAPLDSLELAAALRRVSAAASADTESPLGVVLLDVTGSAVTVVATDRYWLATWSIPLPGLSVAECRVAVPAAEVPGLVTWLSRQDTVTLSVANRQTALSTGDSVRPVPTVADRFPAYRLVLQAQPASRGRVTADREQLLAALPDDGATTRLAVGCNRLTVSSREAVEGAHLVATTVGEPIAIDFATGLLRSALGALVGAEATLSYAAPDRAVRMSSAEQRQFTAVVMPFRSQA